MTLSWLEITFLVLQTAKNCNRDVAAKFFDSLTLASENKCGQERVIYENSAEVMQKQLRIAKLDKVTNFRRIGLEYEDRSVRRPTESKRFADYYNVKIIKMMFLVKEHVK